MRLGKFSLLLIAKLWKSNVVIWSHYLVRTDAVNSNSDAAPEADAAAIVPKICDKALYL